MRIRVKCGDGGVNKGWREVTPSFAIAASAIIGGFFQLLLYPANEGISRRGTAALLARSWTNEGKHPTASRIAPRMGIVGYFLYKDRECLLQVHRQTEAIPPKL